MKRGLFCLVLCAIAGSAAAAQTPQQQIEAFYKLREIPTKAAAIDRYFAHDLAAAIKKDIAPKDEVGETNDFDYRYDAQDMKITGLKFTTGAVSAARADVTATFKDFGKPGQATYRLCPGKAGWKIADVQLKDWDMRAVLHLPAAAINC